MGYVINLVDQDFCIASRDKPYALAEVPGPTTDDGGVRPWMSSASPKHEWDYLTEALSDWRFDAKTNNMGDVVRLIFTGEKTGDEEEMFEAIAPWVQDGSHLEFRGEDGQRWRHEFYGDGMTTVGHKDIVIEESESVIADVIAELESAEESHDKGGVYYRRGGVENAIQMLHEVLDNDVPSDVYR